MGAVAVMVRLVGGRGGWWRGQCLLSSRELTHLLSLPRLPLPMHLPPLPAAAPTFLRCTISAKKCGLEAYGSSAPRLEACTLEQCGEQGVRAQEGAAPLLHG